MDKIRKIIHIDMDAFYASIEQRDRPELKAKPIVVGGDSNSRGVVAACSYEARKFGIHSAMASSRAYKLCPHAIFIKPRFDVYQSVSSEIREIFHKYTDIIEPLSLDEAFLDVTENKMGMISATLIAQEILKEIYERIGLTASAGISFNKFLAKVGSDFNKPNGITVIRPDDAADFIDKLPIRKFFGVGKVTEKRMHKLGIKTGDDLKKMDKETLITTFGKVGHYFYDIAHGIDNRPVDAERIRKSIGKETTFREDIDDKEQMIEILEQLAVKIDNLLKRDGRKGMTITLKVKYFDFQCITKGITIRESLNDANVIMKYVRALLDNTEAGMKKVRLLGISISNFEDESCKVRKDLQLYLPFNSWELENPYP